jgi:hypothetical protein
VVTGRAALDHAQTLAGLCIVTVCSAFNLNTLVTGWRSTDGVMAGCARRHKFKTKDLRSYVLSYFARNA